MMHRQVLRVALLVAGTLFAPAVAVAADEPMVVVTDWNPAKPAARDTRQFRDAMLATHNRSRRDLGVAPLAWDAELEAAAFRYAEELAAHDKFEHSASDPGRPEGENLWMGTRQAFSYTEMTGSWLDEGEAFKPGQFPHVSRTGAWQDVGHYTQMVWAGTQKVGCAIASNARDDYLVCRYWPAGNVSGRNPIR